MEETVRVAWRYKLKIKKEIHIGYRLCRKWLSVLVIDRLKS